MGTFRQLGDPVCPDCLCQHHGAEYAEHRSINDAIHPYTYKDDVANGGTVIQQAITITERCCVSCNAAIVTGQETVALLFHIERPIGTIRTSQRDYITNGDLELHHVAAWEVLDPGTYTYYVMNRSGSTQPIICTWVKIIASDCEA